MIFLAVLLLLIIIAQLEVQSKILYGCLCLMAFIVAVHFTEGYDLGIYEIIYESPLEDVESDEKSVLFSGFMLLCNTFGVSFYHFRIICFLLWSIPIFMFIYKCSCFPTWVLALCIFFPIITFGSQMRNGVAMGFVYWAFFVIYFRQDIIGKIIFVSLLCFAGLIHYVAFFYILALLALWNYIRTDILLICCLSVLFIILFGLQSGLLYQVTGYLFGDYYADFYFSQIDAFVWGNSHLFVTISLNAWFAYFAEKVESMFVSEDSKEWMFSHFVSRLNIVLLPAMALLFVSFSFYRIYQNTMILTALSVANASRHYIDYSSGNNPLRNSYLILMFVITFMFNFGQGTFFEFFSSISLL